jgi:hypothetical protein
MEGSKSEVANRDLALPGVSALLSHAGSGPGRHRRDPGVLTPYFPEDDPTIRKREPGEIKKGAEGIKVYLCLISSLLSRFLRSRSSLRERVP